MTTYYTETITETADIDKILNDFAADHNVNKIDGEWKETGTYNGCTATIFYDFEEDIEDKDSEDIDWYGNIDRIEVEYEDIDDQAVHLYDGGYRPADEEEIAEEYGISRGLAHAICEEMEAFAERLASPIATAIAHCDEDYQLADIDSPSEAEAIIGQLSESGRGIVVPAKGQGFERIARATIDMDALMDVEAAEVKDVVRDIAGILEQADEMLKDAIPKDRTLTATKRVRRSGNSLMIPVTEEAGMLGIRQGDIVEITIRRV